jgi:lysophospholipid acyltransferase (LPLAT)-like uncharacterized protein
MTDTPKKQYDWKFRLIVTVVPRLFCLVTSALYSTLRITIVGKEHEDRFLRQGQPALYVSWHQGVLYFAYHFRNRNGLVMVSRSKDGELIARVAELHGFRSARGSSSRGGKEALQEMIDQINRTRCSGGLVADGPRGPAGVAKIGILRLAKETGLPLIPVMWWAKPKIMFKSWDKTLLPLPFSRMVFSYGAPITVPADATDEQMERMRADLTDRMNRMLREVQEYFDAR